MNLGNLTLKIEEWAVDRGLDEAEPSKQLNKLMEEVGELAEGINKDNQEQIIDSIGDVYVVLVILCQQLDLSLNECVATAYKEISNRKGKTIDGMFVKEEDLK